MRERLRLFSLEKRHLRGISSRWEGVKKMEPGSFQ